MDPRDSPPTFIDAVPNPPAAGSPFGPAHYGGGSQPSSAKKKRGRPRKYSPDGGGVATSPSDSVALVGPTGGTPPSGTSAKRRGRPPGTGKKQLTASGSFGVNFTPHVIMVEVGEDIASKILAFSHQGPQTICVLSAYGAVSNVTLRQPSILGGTMTYEGRYEIISLSGSYLLSESNGSHSRTGGLSVSLAGPDGHVLGGGISGVLRAAVPVQVIVGSFIAEWKKPKSGPSSAPQPNVLNFGIPEAVASPPSQAHSSESEEENGNASHDQAPVFYNNNNSNSSQAFHSMPVYPNLIWPNRTAQMLPQ